MKECLALPALPSPVAASPVAAIVLPARKSPPRHPAWGEKIFKRTPDWTPGVLLDTWA